MVQPKKPKAPKKGRGQAIPLAANRSRTRPRPWRGLVDGVDQSQSTGLPPPLQQGDLDGLCGLYATINAIRLAYRPYGRLNREKTTAIVEALLDLIDDKWGLRQVVTTGLEEDEMQIVIHHGLKLASLFTNRRFWRCRKSLQAIERAKDNWLPVVGVLSVFPANALIVGITGKISHWSVLAEVTRTAFVFHDSDELARLAIGRCSWGRSPKGRTTPTHHLKVSSVIRCR